MGIKKDCPELYQLCKAAADIMKKAEQFGIFVEDGDLLKCLQCGLLEDVLVDGRLVTYFLGKKPTDTGMRFKAMKGKQFFQCPSCQTKVKLAGLN